MAKESLRAQGVNQWQDGYPDEGQIRSDIERNVSYKLLDAEKIVGTAVIDFDGDENYDHIYNGEWLSNGSYAAIHRIAVDNTIKGNGFASQFIKHAVRLCTDRNIHSIRVDTHQDNLSMQKFLKKNGFTQCGVIYLARTEGDNKRIAFEMIF